MSASGGQRDTEELSHQHEPNPLLQEVQSTSAYISPDINNHMIKMSSIMTKNVIN